MYKGVPWIIGGLLIGIRGQELDDTCRKSLDDASKRMNDALSALYQEEASVTSAAGCDMSGLVTGQLPERQCSATVNYQDLASYGSYYDLCSLGNTIVTADYKVECRILSNGRRRTLNVIQAPICSADPAVCDPNQVAMFYFDYTDKMKNADCTFQLQSYSSSTVTSAPTSAPITLNPSSTPSTSPSSTPSFSTNSPTKTPTNEPSLSPTRTLSSSPTRAPTKDPARQLTPAPSMATPEPSGSPSTKPIPLPTPTPTIVPTPFPTATPTILPPTTDPTSTPGTIATDFPTKESPIAPVLLPSSAPSLSPTAPQTSSSFATPTPPGALSDPPSNEMDDSGEMDDGTTWHDSGEEDDRANERDGAAAATKSVGSKSSGILSFPWWVLLLVAAI